MSHNPPNSASFASQLREETSHLKRFIQAIESLIRSLKSRESKEDLRHLATFQQAAS